MKIYTKGGDKGQTSLLGGTRVTKSNIRIEAYGTIDELNSHLGYLRDQLQFEEIREDLLIVQNKLFVIGSMLACEVDPGAFQLSDISSADIRRLEKRIDGFQAELPELKNFLLPGGHPIVSQCHIARCVCRRAERNVVTLHQEEPVDELIIRYLNRLSDFLFVLSRKLGHDLGVDEVPWTSGR